MLNSNLIGNIKNLPNNVDLRHLNVYLQNTPFSTVVGFRCLNPSTYLNYPIDNQGVLLVTRSNGIMQLTYITQHATFESGFINLNDGSTKHITWTQRLDGHQKTVLDKTSPSGVFGLITDSEIQKIIEKYIIPFDDTALWRELEDKITKERINQFANSINPTLERKNGITVSTEKGIWVEGGNVIAGANGNIRVLGGTKYYEIYGGLMVDAKRTSTTSVAYAYGEINLYGANLQAEARIKGGHGLVIQCKNRPVLSTFGDISADKNREVALRGDLRWKIFYNGRQGFKDMAYPAHAREVLVQLYTDIGGRIHRNNAGVYWRDERYCEFEPMHFIRGIYNVVNQDTGFCYHHGDATIHVRHIGADHVRNSRAGRTLPRWEGNAGPGPYGAFDHFPSIRRVWWR